MLQQKTAIITGASRGIGRAIALGLAQDGFHPILISRAEDKMQSLAEEIVETTNHMIHPEIYLIDVSDHEKVEQTVRKILKEHKRIDVLVNNAGIWLEGSYEPPVEDFKKVMDTNLVAPYVFIREVVKQMKTQKSGYIFNVASRAGKVGFKQSGIYSASKFGLVGLGESLYRELMPLGIKVTTLCPGWVNTDMAEGAPVPFEEMIQPEDLVETIRWLLKLINFACVKYVLMECKGSIA